MRAASLDVDCGFGGFRLQYKYIHIIRLGDFIRKRALTKSLIKCTINKPGSTNWGGSTAFCNYVELELMSRLPRMQFLWFTIANLFAIWLPLNITWINKLKSLDIPEDWR